MDKISKRSKGYAFVEYTTEEAASAALKEMNGKVNKHEFYFSLSFPLLLSYLPYIFSVFDADHQWLDDSCRYC